MDIKQIDNAIAKQRTVIAQLREQYQRAVSRQEDYQAGKLRQELGAAICVSADLAAIRKRAAPMDDSSSLRPSSYFVGGNS